MTKLTTKLARRRGIISPDLTSSREELARLKAEDKVEYQRYRAIVERLRPDLITDHYAWYIAIELNSGDHVTDQDKEAAHKKAREKFPNADHCVFYLNEFGAVSRI
jgi:hypothetical protein